MLLSANSLPGPDDIVRQELNNGITVLVRENHISPSVVVAGYLQVGGIDVAAEHAGLAYFTAAALMRGTEKRDFSEIYEAIESVGATASFSSGGHTTSFGAKSLAEDLPLILDILSASIRHPTFPAHEVERLRGQILTSLEERANDTGAVASLAFRELAYPAAHPYSRSVRGYPETIQALQREDLIRFYREGYGAQGMVVCVVGAVTVDEAVAQVAAALGEWQGNNFSRPPLPPVQPPNGLVSTRVGMPNKSQTDMVMGWPGPRRAEPDYLDAALCNTILGVFGMMGRLGERLRDQQGLAYYVSSQLEGGIGPGPWSISAGVDPGNVERIIEGARQEVRLMRDTLVDDEELADVKNFIVGSLPLHLETNEGVAGAILELERYDLGLNYLARYPGLVHAVTAERVRTAAARWLDPDNVAISVAGSLNGEEEDVASVGRN